MEERVLDGASRGTEFVSSVGNAAAKTAWQGDMAYQWAKLVSLVTSQGLAGIFSLNFLSSAGHIMKLFFSKELEILGVPLFYSRTAGLMIGNGVLGELFADIFGSNAADLPVGEIALAALAKDMGKDAITKMQKDFLGMKSEESNGLLDEKTQRMIQEKLGRKVTGTLSSADIRALGDEMRKPDKGLLFAGDLESANKLSGKLGVAAATDISMVMIKSEKAFLLAFLGNRGAVVKDPESIEKVLRAYQQEKGITDDSTLSETLKAMKMDMADRKKYDETAVGHMKETALAYYKYVSTPQGAPPSRAFVGQQVTNRTLESEGWFTRNFNPCTDRGLDSLEWASLIPGIGSFVGVGVAAQRWRLHREAGQGFWTATGEAAPDLALAVVPFGKLFKKGYGMVKHLPDMAMSLYNGGLVSTELGKAAKLVGATGWDLAWLGIGVPAAANFGVNNRRDDSTAYMTQAIAANADIKLQNVRMDVGSTAVITPTVNYGLIAGADHISELTGGVKH